MDFLIQCSDYMEELTKQHTIDPDNDTATLVIEAASEHFLATRYENGFVLAHGLLPKTDNNFYSVEEIRLMIDAERSKNTIKGMVTAFTLEHILKKTEDENPDWSLPDPATEVCPKCDRAFSDFNVTTIMAEGLCNDCFRISESIE